MVRQLTKIFTLLTVLLLTAFISTSTVQAYSKVNEVKYVKTYDTEVDGKAVMRIEIGLKSDDLQNYNVEIPNGISSKIIVDFANTVPGKISKNQGNAIEFKTEGKLTVEIPETNSTRLEFELPFIIKSGNYNDHSEPSSKKDKLPYRIVIDIDKAAAERNNGFKKDSRIPKIGSGGVSPITKEVNPYQYNINKNNNTLFNNDFDGDFDNDGNMSIVSGSSGKYGSIVIDAGHGGGDSGAGGPNGVFEKEVTLAVALKVQRLLENSGAKVVMTRETDRDVSWAGSPNGKELQARVDVTPPDGLVFVSIHCNAFSNPASHGMETFYYWGSSEGQKLAKILNEELANFGNRFNRGVKGANFYVLKHAKVPASLVELAFITNPEEEYLLADEDYQQQLAIAITRGIKRYLGIDPNGSF